jgi:hypothetical protein
MFTSPCDINLGTFICQWNKEDNVLAANQILVFYRNNNSNVNHKETVTLAANTDIYTVVVHTKSGLFYVYNKKYNV